MIDHFQISKLEMKLFCEMFLDQNEKYINVNKIFNREFVSH